MISVLIYCNGKILEIGDTSQDSILNMLGLTCSLPVKLKITWLGICLMFMGMFDYGFKFGHMMFKDMVLDESS